MQAPVSGMEFEMASLYKQVFSLLVAGKDLKCTHNVCKRHGEFREVWNFEPTLSSKGPGKSGFRKNTNTY